MTDTQSTTPSAPDLTPPPAVAALLDEASVDSGPYSAAIGSDRVDLVETATGRVVRTALWPEAGRWGRNVLRHTLTATLGAPQEATPSGR